MENKQTAVNWLIEQLKKAEYLGTFCTADAIAEEEQKMLLICQQAKEMEKKQIEEAYKYARAHWSREDGNAERYYEQTYGGNK
jgi:hypothetical protein